MIYPTLVHRYALEEREFDAFLVAAAAAPRDDKRTLFVASTADEDRAGDIVRQDWRLGPYKANPVILDNHYGMRVVGRADEARVPKDTGALEILVAWDLQNPDPTIAAVGHQHLNGFRAAGSVGFRSGKKTARNKLPTDHEAYREEQTVEERWGASKHAGVYHEKNELYEFSSASVPMNPKALHREPRTKGAELADHAATVEDEVKRAELVVRETLPRVLQGELLSLIRSDATIRRVILSIVESSPASPRPEAPASPLRGDGLDHLFA